MRLGYQPALDGLRGVAIALVVGFHAFRWPADGALGVDLFFVLSGFLITSLLLEEHHASGRVSLRGFYVRRVHRLYPALVVLLLALVSISLAGAGIPSLHSPMAVGVASALTYTSNAVVAAGPAHVPASMVHLWSLAAEEQFYVVWPLLLVILLRWRRLRPVVMGLLVLLLAAVAYRMRLVLDGESVGRLYYGPDTHADSLLVGCLVACGFHASCLPRALSASPKVRLAVGTASLGLLGAASIFLTEGAMGTAYRTQLLPTGVALLAGALIASLVAGGSMLARALSMSPLVGLGRISYSLYLWHLPILVAVAGVERAFDVRTVAAVAVSVIVAVLSRRFVELRFLRRRTAEAVPQNRATSPATVVAYS
jgi:peptidoglycan/LPS O-acetylase OafA/YrhL